MSEEISSTLLYARAGDPSLPKVILPEIPELNKIEVYERNGGYGALKKALSMEPDAVTDEVKKSGLRGRGGAAFPTGLKWTFMPKQTPKPKYLAVNADESEPGSFKDRQILEFNPHQLIEGILIASYAMGARAAYIYVRGEYYKWLKLLEKAVEESYSHGYIGQNICGSNYSVDVYAHRGAGAYISGEETGLMESLEGKRGYPRVKPPFPAQNGLWGNPTTVNNVETLANVPAIISNGSDWFLRIGAQKQPGTLLFGVSGHVNKPGVFELPTGTLLTDIIYKYAGGVLGGKKIKMVIPGGTSMPPLRGDQIEGVRMDAESLKSVGSAIGTGGVIVMDEDTNLLKVLLRITKFYWHESCGQCTPCREGTGWMLKIFQRLSEGGGKPQDLDLLVRVANNIEGNTICALGDAAAWPVKFTIQRFRKELEEEISRQARNAA
ncbi:MAG TPA: NADH-quinone oxidoreductase subunit NuoF [Candidatus Kryptonia bacterium]